MEGFTAYISATTVDVSIGHVIVSPAEDEPYIKRAQEVKREIEGLGGIAGISVRLIDRTMAIKGKKTVSMVLRGIEPESEARTTTIAAHTIKGQFLEGDDRKAIVLGDTLARKLDLEPGESLSVLFSNGSRVTFTVKGIYSTGLRDLDNGGYVSLKRLQGILDLPNRASEIAVRLTDEKRSGDYRGGRIGSDVTVETWQDRMAFIGSMRQNMGIIQTMAVALSLIAAGIATVVLMYTNIQHKVRSIGILKAIGAKNQDILALYVLEGLILGVAGATVGDVLGSAICLYLSANPIQVSLGASEGTATLIAVNTVFSRNLLISPTITAVLVTLLASFYPAWQAARINIIEAIWHE
jgi:ABC-type lipoprotein release transport system permease subunit